MLSILHSARKGLGVTERRVRTRTLVTPPIYVDLGKVNGGLIYNMSEDGLALSAAMILGGDGLVSMRILLPDSGGWMEATGQLTWKSESRKTAGIRFVGLPEEARQRITDWLAAESSQRELQPDAEILPRPQQHNVADTPARTPIFSSPDPVDSSTVAEKGIPQPLLPEDSSDQRADIVAEFFQQSKRAASHNLAGGDSSGELRERRGHPRQQIRPLSYIELGRANGGMLLNISEGGLAVTAAMILTEDDLPTIRIQFTGSQDEIEVSGQIAWISESKREAGIRFVNLTEAARKIIASRISPLESPSELQAQSAQVPDGPAVHREVPEKPDLRILAPVHSPSGSLVREHRRVSAPPPLAVPGFLGDNVAPTPAASHALRPKTSGKTEFKRKSTPAIHPMISEGGAERRRRLAVAVILSGVAAVAIGWIARPPGVRKESIGFIGQNTKGTNEPIEANKALPARKTTDVPALRSENTGPQAHGFDQVPGNGSEGHLAPVRPQVRNVERPAATTAVESAVRRAESTLPKSQPPAKPPERTAVAVPHPAMENVRSQVVEASPAQPTASTATPATNLSAKVPSGTAAAEVKEKESPPPPLKQPAAPMAPTWSVAVSTDPYPSIRIPEDISSQKPSNGRSLQIGRAISRVEPVYPEDAKRQGIEGTVKLHVVVGGDGSVQSVELTSGPALLAKAATSAIREWRYGQTLLGGQPVETEQDVIVKFRLAGPSNPN